MEFTVFYAWQSDRPEKTNRYLIRDAAKEALKQIDKDASIQESPRLDHDTKGVSGMPDIVGTIFKKIEGCGVFLADLTFVGTTQEGKQLPNPNVVLELGYAARCVGWERIICVANEAFGQTEELIFDIKHRRWPISYNLVESQAREEVGEVKRKLTNQIKEAVLAVLSEEYTRVKDAISSLSSDAILFISRNYFLPIFSGSDEEPEEKRHAIDRLLDLKLIELNVVYQKGKGTLLTTVYSWTYLGEMVIKKLNCGIL